MVAAPGVELLHGGDGLPDGQALAGAADVVVIQGQQGVVPLFDGYGNVSHQGVEVLGPFHQADGKDELGVLFVLGLNGYLTLGEHIPGAETQLQGVAQVNRNG